MSFISLDNISFSYSDIESGQPYKMRLTVFLSISKRVNLLPFSVTTDAESQLLQTSQRNAIAG